MLVQPIKHPFKTGRLEFRVDYVSFAGTPNFALIVWPEKKFSETSISRSFSPIGAGMLNRVWNKGEPTVAKRALIDLPAPGIARHPKNH